MRDTVLDGRTRDRQGLTMLEIVISLILVSSLLLVSLQASGRLLRIQSIGSTAVQSRELGGMWLDEISAMSFQDLESSGTFGLETGETAGVRSAYDDVDDYHGYSTTSPTHRDGTAMVGFVLWSVSVSVTPAVYSASGVTLTADPKDPFRVITVTCTAPDGYVGTQSTLVSDVPDDLPETTSYARLRRDRFTFSSDRVLDVVVPLRNHPTMGY
ncbi:ubiquitin family protein [Stieleria varia]|uniref:Prepilin-type N-terminal cleavage/methylation domain-containing protein n=1 Tax=Stieleria varia TaxID=2528005 RepID=A0A5C6B6Z1_9BACT|nr:hypothetical protein [Stieleria varia]TWU07537.1 hypothetical protein Pla52n_01100 [Stieleria varia]